MLDASCGGFGEGCSAGVLAMSEVGIAVLKCGFFLLLLGCACVSLANHNQASAANVTNVFQTIYYVK